MGKIGFFHLGTPETAFLVRNLPIDPCNLGIFHNKPGYPFQFPKKNRGGLPLLPGSLPLLTYFKLFMFRSEKFPEVSRKYVSYGGWRVIYSEPRKTNFINELMEVSRILSTYILLRSSKYLNNTYENLQTFSIKFFFLFLKHC